MTIFFSSRFFLKNFFQKNFQGKIFQNRSYVSKATPIFFKCSKRSGSDSSLLFFVSNGCGSTAS